MPNITKRLNKDGSASYLIRVYVDITGNGHQIMKSMTWRPAVNMKPSAVEKELNRQATLFEDKVKQGLISAGGSAHFGDYASDWIELQPLAPKTHELYVGLMDRINTAIGHIRLDKLTAHHLEQFYKNLSEPGVRQRAEYAVTNKLPAIIKKQKISGAALARKAGVSDATIIAAKKGNHIRPAKAEVICKALDCQFNKLFALQRDDKSLTGNTIAHYHRFISAVLMTAKKQRLIPFNVASEQCTPPKVEHKEARYLDDNQARQFLGALMDEPDIRVKASLILLLFSGMRRGELLGLSWPDIDMGKQIIHIRRSSQVQKGKGVTEAPTKNKFSVRDVRVSGFVFELLAQYRVWWNEHRLQYGTDWHGEKERLFIQDDGSPLYPDTINFWLKKFLEHNSIPYITPHSLRHTFCTLELAAGTDYRTLQSLSGHAQASTLVNIYGHVLESAQRKAADALERVLLPPQNENIG